MAATYNPNPSPGRLCQKSKIQNDDFDKRRKVSLRSKVDSICQCMTKDPLRFFYLFAAICV